MQVLIPEHESRFIGCSSGCWRFFGHFAPPVVSVPSLVDTPPVIYSPPVIGTPAVSGVPCVAYVPLVVSVPSDRDAPLLVNVF